MPADSASAASAYRRLRDWLIGTLGMMVAAPVIGLLAGFLLLFGGMFLGMAWQIALKPFVDARHYAAYTSETSGRIVESWAALAFDPADLAAGKLYWDRVSKISRCVVVEYETASDWNAPLRRAYCGMRIDFSENFRLFDWSEMLQEGIPFTFLRDAGGFEVQELRMSRATLDWISKHPPRDTFMMSKPPPATALAALREQFDWPIDVAVLSWTKPVPAVPLRYDPQHPQEAMPAQVVGESRNGNPLAIVLALILAVPGFFVWRLAIRVFFPSEPSPWVLWLLTLLQLLALPWWSEALPKLIARANRNWAQIATAMLEDVTRASRLIASSSEDAEFANGERLLWHLDQGEYADTFGRIHFAKPEPAPKTADDVLAALRAQAAAQIAAMPGPERTALLQRLNQDHANRRDRVRAVFKTAAENTLRDASTGEASHKAARRFLSIADGGDYYEDQLDKIEAARDAASAAPSQ